MKKSFKKFYKGYSEWCKEGKKHGYSDFLQLVCLGPIIIFLIVLCYVLIQIDKDADKINEWNKEITKANEELSRKAADKMSEDETSDN